MSAKDQFTSGFPVQSGCGCGLHASQHEHDSSSAYAGALASGTLASEDKLIDAAVTTAAMNALFPDPRVRRRFIKAVGSSTAFAALASFFPLAQAQAIAKESKGVPEKPTLDIGFLPITCATPIVLAEALGFYQRQGLKVNLQRTAGWALVRDRTLNGELDASQMLSPMPLAITLGLGAAPTPMVMPALENLNGNAITLSTKLADRRDPKTWKGLRFGIPFEFSMHNFLLRHYLAENGINPDRDVQMRVLPPADMVSNLRAGSIDGFIVAEPFNQRAVVDGIGFIHMLTSEIWDGHPCCAFAATERFAREAPNSFSALFRAIVTATIYSNQQQNRGQIAQLLSAPQYLNQPVTVLEQVLTGKFADGLGQVRNVPNRISFDPFPWQSMAVWMLVQMRRWGYIKQEVDYRKIAEQVFLATDARRRMAELGFDAPKTNMRTHTIMGRVFDPARPDAYLASLPKV